jgi:hypothetical protein
MEGADGELREFGSFDPHSARRILEEFEAAKIPFQVSVDNSANLEPGRIVAFGMSQEGSRIVILVPDGRMAAAQAVFDRLYPG